MNHINYVSKDRKALRRILCTLLCVLLIFGLFGSGNRVQAADTGTITIVPPQLPAGVTDTNADPTTKPSYTVYRVFQGNGNGTAIRYSLLPGRSTSDAAWTSANMGQYFDVDGGGNVKIKDGAGAYTTTDGKAYLTEAATKAVGDYVKDAQLSGTSASYDAAEKSYKLTGVTDGYYYITTTTGSVVMINTRNGEDEVTVQDKNTFPSVDKKQTTELNGNGSPVNYTDEDVNVATGDTIYYEAIVNVPSGIDEDIVLSDHLSVAFIPNFEPVATGTDQDEHTRIKAGDITVQYQGADNNWETLDGGTSGSENYVITANWTADDKTHIHGFTVHIKPTEATKGRTLRFLYSATVGGGFMNDDSQDKNGTGKLIDQKRNRIDLTYKTYTQTDKVFFHTDCAGAIKYDTSTADVDSNNKLTAKPGKAINYLPEAKFKLQERLKTSENEGDWSDVPVVCNGMREFYRPAVLNKEETERQHKWVGTDGDNVLDYQSENGFIQANEGEKSDLYNRGWIAFRGLDPDKQYRLIEVTAPDGYNRLTAPVVLNQEPDTKFKVSLSGKAPEVDGNAESGKHEEYYWRERTTFIADSDIAKIGNTPGVVLPSTGGTGVAILRIAGGVLAGAAALLLIRRKRTLSI